jgi:hypothetical protein
MDDSLAVYRTTWQQNVIFYSMGVRYYANGDFMVTKGGSMDFCHRCALNRWLWAGSPYRTGLFGEMRIPLFVTDDFGNLIQVSKK